jgi:hypothetical protein
MDHFLNLASEDTFTITLRVFQVAHSLQVVPTEILHAFMLSPTCATHPFLLNGSLKFYRWKLADVTKNDVQSSEGDGDMEGMTRLSTVFAARHSTHPCNAHRAWAAHQPCRCKPCKPHTATHPAQPPTSPSAFSLKETKHLQLRTEAYYIYAIFIGLKETGDTRMSALRKWQKVQNAAVSRTVKKWCWSWGIDRKIITW